jgi:hypothetical protein
MFTKSHLVYARNGRKLLLLLLVNIIIGALGMFLLFLYLNTFTIHLWIYFFEIILKLKLETIIINRSALAILFWNYLLWLYYWFIYIRIPCFERKLLFLHCMLVKAFFILDCLWANLALGFNFFNSRGTFRTILISRIL